MYLSKLQIKNFKSFENVSFDFHPKVNVLTGVNNAGKTTALEAIALWYECYKKLIRQAPGSGTDRIYISGDYILGMANWQYFPASSFTSVRSPNYNDIFTNLQKGTIELTATFQSQNDATKNLDISIQLGSSDGGNYKIFCKNFKTLNYRLFNDRLFLKDPQDGIQLTYASPIAQVMPIEEKQMVSKIKFLKQSRSSSQVFRNRLRQLESRRNGDFDRFVGELKAILTNNGTEDIKFTFGTDANDLNEVVTIQIGRDTPKDLSLLGSGTLQIIELLLSLFEENRDLSLILLDEPDSHIHHSMQRRLLNTLENFSPNGQVFLTTHNESLIRAAKPEWVFHLEQPPQNHYQPIINQSVMGIKKGFQPTLYSPIILNLTGGNTLDFIQALESDKLILVEGRDDAARCQKILSLRTSDTQRYAYWSSGGVDSYFMQLGAMKSIFENIKNRQSLWQKSILIMDKDDMTDMQRQNIIDGFTNTVGIKTHIWASYNFESVLLTDFNKLSDFLAAFIKSRSISIVDINAETIKARLETAALTALEELKTLYESEKELKFIIGKIQSRRNVFTNKPFGINLRNVFEEDIDLKIRLVDYYKSCFSLPNMHKICRKEQLEWIIKEALAPNNIPFTLEQDFDDLFSFVKNSATLIDGYRFMLTI
jgi:AAA15 family ATPase/GTPase